MAKKKDGCRLMLATAAVVVAFAYGCGGQPAVDPGGSLVSEEGQIAFTRFPSFTPPNFESGVHTINVDGSGERRIADSPGLDAFPTSSPDGTRIAFTSDGTEEVGEIYVMNADGSGLTKLTDNPSDDSFPAWRP